MSLSSNEKTIARKIGKFHKYVKDYPSPDELNRLKAFICGVGMINLLLDNGQFDVVVLILSYISDLKVLINLAAAANDLFFQLFWNPTKAGIGRKFMSYFELKSFFHNEPSPLRLATLSSGKELLREYRLFKRPNTKRKIFSSGLLPNLSLTSANFNPVHPLVAITLQTKIIIVAFGGKPK